ncbi:AraC family transcriptional regulator [Olivibacter sp. SDN3]|uniref:helix-turn-helix domain-containing protein n=1 Tax=Olivibacter sp. SDN3 TaxID=2764720 RepID=UPI0016513ECA|nr:helix-turn-helix domain-containing protein [Olivibacter sp. SDN3]QNL51903.1 AraC family transcriptional regulator [Olivibacter sp. SDN3]
MKKDGKLVRYSSIPDIHTAFGLPKPQHPLISLTYFARDKPLNPYNLPGYDVLSFYKITFLLDGTGRLKYGQHHYDFGDGGMLFLAPNQLVGTSDSNGDATYYILLLHPDFLHGYPLAKKIKQYSYFSYSVNEGLHLSEDEKQTILSVYMILEKELNSRIDEYSQEVVVAQLELLLSYVNRFYKRQFITRKTANKDLLQKTEALLDDYFNNELSLNLGIPTVRFLAEKLNLSAGYLSDMLRALMGKSAKQYIHEKLIEKAKEKLSTTSHSVSEIAYALGFEHSQSFSKLFRQKTNQSPLEYRAGFN